MSGYASYDDALDPKYGEPFPVPVVMATKEALKGYGTIVTTYDETKVEITPWPWIGDQCTAINKAVGGNYVIGRLPSNVSPSNRTHVLVREANYHPDGGQVFYPVNKDPFIALLALPGDDIKLEDFVAFYFDGSFGVQIHADIWHQPVYPINDEATFVGKQGAVHACVAVDTVDEFSKYLLVPLSPPE
ncbi:ALLA-like protein [Mya arenaria]|uniref:ALLA-like protein n=1 Tax=Mya arenaria TaxID=6604 RepID=A0ABY7FDB3_MYAAR|nr:ALLA-like protein [Mya arenaria]